MYGAYDQREPTPEEELVAELSAEEQDLEDQMGVRDADIIIPKRKRRSSRCADCGKRGARTGHQDCPFPQDHP